MQISTTNYRKLRRKYKKNRTEKNKEELNNIEKYYKRTLDKNQKLYRNKITKQLRNLRTNNPKEYWKILNSGRHKKQPNISIEDLLQFKKKLNGAPLNFDEIDIPSLNDDMMNGQNYNLNLYIQKDEIIKCIQKLKNNKAGGEDAIINEYINIINNNSLNIKP